MQSKGNKIYRGIDVSNHQQDIDFGAVKNSGIQIVYMKASESNFYRDKYLDQNYANAKAQGLKVGFYHFFRCDVDAVEQARYFVNCIQGKDSDCKLCIDIETTEGQNSNTITNMCIAFLEEVKRLTGKDVVVYTYTSFARSNLTGTIGGYALWIADYRGENALPNDNPIWSEWVGYQYASDGQVNGVNGNCDVDLFTDEILLDNRQFRIHMFAHIESDGNKEVEGYNDVTIGTVGESKRDEALEVNIDGIKTTLDVHLQDYGDVLGVVDGQVQGSMRESKRIEAVRINILEIPQGYKVIYQAHVENKGWIDWVEAGQWAGTKGESLRLEALRVKVVKK